MRLREMRDWGLLFMPIVKLVSRGCGVAGAEIFDVGVYGSHMFGVQGPGGLD